MTAQPHFYTDRTRINHAVGLTPKQRVLAGFEQSELAIEVVRDGIRDQNPDADESTIEHLLLERVNLMRKLQKRSIPKQ